MESISLGSDSVEEELPLKQGLKHKIKNTFSNATKGWRGTSIKTRIETQQEYQDPFQ